MASTAVLPIPILMSDLFVSLSTNMPYKREATIMPYITTRRPWMQNLLSSSGSVKMDQECEHTDVTNTGVTNIASFREENQVVQLDFRKQKRKAKQAMLIVLVMQRHTLLCYSYCYLLYPCFKELKTLCVIVFLSPSFFTVTL